MMKKLLWPLLFSVVSLTAHAQLPSIQAQYCLGVYVGRDEVMKDVAEAARSEPDTNHRQFLEKWISDHEQAKEQLYAYLESHPAPASMYLLLGQDWQQRAMKQARIDLNDDAASRTACDVAKKKCRPSEATKRVVRCNDLSWLK